MAYTAPSTHVDSYIVTAADWNEIINDLIALRNSSAVVLRSAPQSINDSALTTISFDTESLDEEGYYAAGSPTRLTLPRKGIYALDVEVQFASNAVGYRQAILYRNGVDETTINAAPVNGAITSVKFPFLTIQRTVGDYYEVKAWQNSTGALNVTARVGIVLQKDNT